MFRKIDDFNAAWAQEMESTLKVLGSISDEALSQKVDAHGRTLGKLAWHLVETLQEMLPAAGLKVDFHIDPTDVPTSASEIVSRYRTGAVLLGEAVSSQWDDAALATETNMYGMPWARGYTLLVLLMHQSHHRGQMTVLMRQAELPVPGVCGPARQEWAMMGMEPQD